MNQRDIKQKTIGNISNKINQMENLLSYDDSIHNTLEICNFNNKALALYSITKDKFSYLLPFVVSVVTACKLSIYSV